MSKIDDGWHEILMTWGAYRSGYGPNRLGLGYGQSLLGKLMEGLKGTTCSKCIGRGKVRDIVSDSWAPCPVCKGKGRVNLNVRGRAKANPALIRATAPSYDHASTAEPEICARIDAALQKLTIRHRIILIARYVDYPRRNHGDKRVKHVNHWLDRIGEKPITKRRMENLLSEARREVAVVVSGSG